MKNIYLWKSLQKNSISSHRNFKWKLNKWYKINGGLEICNNGFHASENIIDAIRYVDCEVLAKVEVRGNKIIKKDKQCWSEMRIIEKWVWNKDDSVGLAIYSASLVLNNFEKAFLHDKRPRQAIQSARDYLKRNDKGIAAVWSAVWSAESAASAARSAESAAWSARSAASAVWSAVWSARSVESAARSAVWSARSAESVARSAAWSAASAAESAAESAAWSAAESAAESAASAAESAAESAAWSVAESAAWSARSAVKQKCHNWIIKYVIKKK